MSNTTNYTCHLDNEIKRKSEAVYNELGMNLSTAINIFLRESIRVGGFPFDVRLNKLNKETLSAMLETEQIINDTNVKKYNNVEEALRELKQ